MFSVRVTTVWHGNTNVHILLLNLSVTALLAWAYGPDYITIFCASALLHLILELGLAATGVRKGQVFVYGRKLSRFPDALLRATVEGPGYCVPAFFIADRLMAGQYALGLIAPALLIAAASFYMGWADRRDVARLPAGEAPIYSRRAMTRPGAVMLLSVLNVICLAAVLTMDEPRRTHALYYLGGYASLAMLYYLINYNLGVRMVQLYDCESRSYTTPGPAFQAAALTYDSAYEMCLLISPAYWITAYLGLFGPPPLG